MEEAVTFTTGETSTPPDLRIIHYNDGTNTRFSDQSCLSETKTLTDAVTVYHLDSSSAEPVGGVARFQTLCNYYRNDGRFKGQPKLITLFSGDAFNPSLESSVTKGGWQPYLRLSAQFMACESAAVSNMSDTLL